jgi:hypothetical protein
LKRRFDPVWDTPMSEEEFEKRKAEGIARLSGPEGDEMRELMAWFMQRYPTALDRLRYVRKQMKSMQIVHNHQASGTNGSADQHEDQSTPSSTEKNRPST